MENETNHYLSLTEATKFCDYSQEYLSLRARQGKLKAIKFGRNWVTKKEWLEEYLKKVGSTKHEVEKEIGPQRKLPRVSFEFLKTFAPQKILLVWGLVFVLLVGGVAFGKDSFKYVFEIVEPYVTKFNENVDDFFVSSAQSFVNVGKDIESFVREFNENFNIGMAIESRKSKVKSQKLVEGISSYTYIIVGDLADLFFDFSQNFVNQFPKKIYERISVAVEKFLKSYPVLAEAGKAPTKTFKEYFSWLGGTIVQGIKRISEIFTRPFKPRIIIIEKLSPETEKKIIELE